MGKPLNDDERKALYKDTIYLVLLVTGPTLIGCGTHSFFIGFGVLLCVFLLVGKRHN